MRGNAVKEGEYLISFPAQALPWSGLRVLSQPSPQFARSSRTDIGGSTPGTL